MSDALKCWSILYSDTEASYEQHDAVSEDGRGAMRGGRIRFVCRPQDAKDAEWLYVTESAYDRVATYVPRQRRVLFVMEPPEVAGHKLSYLEQFGIVVSPFDAPGYKGTLIRSNPHLGWWAGSTRSKTLSDVEGFRCTKTRTMSMIASSKTMVPGHRKRLSFMNAIKERFAGGGEIDFFGRDTRPLDDKMDGIAPYRFHIVIENSNHPYYWTEKLTDAWIGWALPVYCGDPTILQQIPDPNGIVLIDIDDIEAASAKLRELLDRPDIYDERLPAIRRCREWAIKESDVKEMMCRIIESAGEDVRSVPMLASPETIVPRANTVRERLVALSRRLFGRRATVKLLAIYKKILRR